MNEEKEKRRKLIAEVKRAKSNIVSVKSASPATYTTGGRGDETNRLHVEYWKAKKIWEDHEIPYLFLGYQPLRDDYDKLDRIEDRIYLNDYEEGKYREYLNAIRLHYS